MVSHLNFDFQKFYECIVAKLQCYALHKVGCPQHGNIKWAMDDLKTNTVYVKTVKAIIKLAFECGYRQGKGLSCPLASLIGRVIGEAWHQSTPNIPTPPTNPYHAYQFRVLNTRDQIS